MKNIYLVGFMCAGKTLTGRALARLLKRKFYDSDLALEKRCGATIAQLLRSNGLSGFRKKEAAQLAALLTRHGLVAALGGGVYPGPRWGKRLAATGTVVYLHCPWPELERRLKASRSGRPLLAGPWSAAAVRAKKLYKKRLGFYRRAEFEINTSRLTPRTAAEKLLKMLAAAAAK